MFYKLIICSVCFVFQSYVQLAFVSTTVRVWVRIYVSVHQAFLEIAVIY